MMKSLLFFLLISPLYANDNSQNTNAIIDNEHNYEEIAQHFDNHIIYLDEEEDKDVELEPLQQQHLRRNQAKKFEWFYPGYDVCLNGPNNYGPCIKSRFPKCKSNEQLCYNRVNRQDKFYPDKVPHFYIDYNRVLCYPNSWAGYGGCSSCSPGRWCEEEYRCILDESGYPCPSWKKKN
mmetsp:Transcript_4643/g.6354  ORF Transcript_4643/g.6354 Transcript_4643/m.6354 type:complete len:178 (-) Transcript_4643:239-772(-)